MDRALLWICEVRLLGRAVHEAPEGFLGGLGAKRIEHDEGKLRMAFAEQLGSPAKLRGRLPVQEHPPEAAVYIPPEQIVRGAVAKVGAHVGKIGEVFILFVAGGIFQSETNGTTHGLKRNLNLGQCQCQCQLQC